VGSTGTITLAQPFKPEAEAVFMLKQIDAQSGEEHVEHIRLERSLLYEGEVEDMHDAILQGTPNRVTLLESRQHIATLCALYDSAKSAKPVVL